MASCCVPTCTGSSMLVISTFARILVKFLFINRMDLSMIWRIPKFLGTYIFGLPKRSEFGATMPMLPEPVKTTVQRY